MIYIHNNVIKLDLFLDRISLNFNNLIEKMFISKIYNWKYVCELDLISVWVSELIGFKHLEVLLKLLCEKTKILAFNQDDSIISHLEFNFLIFWFNYFPYLLPQFMPGVKWLFILIWFFSNLSMFKLKQVFSSNETKITHTRTHIIISFDCFNVVLIGLVLLF